MIFSKILSAPGERHDRTVSHQNVISVKLLQSRFIHNKYYRGFSSVLSFSIPILSSDFCLLTPQVLHMLSRLTRSRIMGSASTSALIGCRSWPPWPWVRFLSGFMVAILWHQCQQRGRTLFFTWTNTADLFKSPLTYSTKSNCRKSLGLNPFDPWQEVNVGGGGKMMALIIWCIYGRR